MPLSAQDESGLGAVLAYRLKAGIAERVVEDVDALTQAIVDWLAAMDASWRAFTAAMDEAAKLEDGAARLVDALRATEEQNGERHAQLMPLFEAAEAYSIRQLEQGEAASADPATSAPDATAATAGAEASAIDAAEAPASASTATEADASDAPVVADNPEGGAEDAASQPANEAPEAPVEAPEGQQPSGADETQTAASGAEAQNAPTPTTRRRKRGG